MSDWSWNMRPALNSSAIGQPSSSVFDMFSRLFG
jgi:hypothetical protein